MNEQKKERRKKRQNISTTTTQGKKIRTYKGKKNKGIIKRWMGCMNTEAWKGSSRKRKRELFDGYFLLTAAPSVGKSSVEAKFGFSFFDGRWLTPLTTVTDAPERICGGR